MRQCVGRHKMTHVGAYRQVFSLVLRSSLDPPIDPTVALEHEQQLKARHNSGICKQHVSIFAGRGPPPTCERCRAPAGHCHAQVRLIHCGGGQSCRFEQCRCAGTKAAAVESRVHGPRKRLPRACKRQSLLMFSQSGCGLENVSAPTSSSRNDLVQQCSLVIDQTTQQTQTSKTHYTDVPVALLMRSIFICFST